MKKHLPACCISKTSDGISIKFSCIARPRWLFSTLPSNCIHIIVSSALRVLHNVAHPIGLQCVCVQAHCSCRLSSTPCSVCVQAHCSCRLSSTPAVCVCRLTAPADSPAHLQCVCMLTAPADCPAHLQCVCRLTAPADCPAHHTMFYGRHPAVYSYHQHNHLLIFDWYKLHGYMFRPTVGHLQASTWYNSKITIANSFYG